MSRSDEMNKCLALMVVAGLTACTTTDDIIVDRKGVDPAKYQQDLAECQGYSSEVKTGEKTARGAASGAVVGGLIGAAVGNSRDAQRGAGAGAVSGAARGASEGSREEVQVVKQCLRGRGYKVLN
ncbi:YMGG-like glycine zipper-containing protein [Halioglobus japonicus]|nr:YMGG-like glycine zipper-containing protein [Halioglobus japonicus]